MQFVIFQRNSTKKGVTTTLQLRASDCLDFDKLV